jgi:pSer/pThr/pTyr-binding forkhead associated (FHA) protein
MTPISLTAQSRINLQIHNDALLMLDAPATEGYVLGRSDHRSSYLPDIDLAPYHARERGVSRRHAVLVCYKDLLHVIDLQSANGTFLNGARLIAEQPYPLQEGDELHLANLTILLMQA